MVAWAMQLNALWLVFSLLGGVVLGIAPATVAACVLSRRRMRGERVRAGHFARVWCAEFLRGNLVMLPALAVAGLLTANYLWFAALGREAMLPRVLTLLALIVVWAAGAYLCPMYAHYDLRPLAYFPKSLRFALARPASTVLLLVVFAALAFASAAMPVLLVTVTIGAWLQTSTWLGVRFFEENEARLTDPAGRVPPTQARILPVEPLRMR